MSWAFAYRTDAFALVAVDRRITLVDGDGDVLGFTDRRKVTETAAGFLAGVGVAEMSARLGADAVTARTLPAARGGMVQAARKLRPLPDAHDGGATVVAVGAGAGSPWMVTVNAFGAPRTTAAGAACLLLFPYGISEDVQRAMRARVDHDLERMAAGTGPASVRAMVEHVGAWGRWAAERSPRVSRAIDVGVVAADGRRAMFTNEEERAAA